MKKHAGYIKPRSLVGLGLIVFAVLLLLDNIGVRFLHTVFHNWPLALIIIGVALLYGSHKSPPAGDSGRVLPYILIGLGLLFFASRFFNFKVGALIIPLVLLFVGLHVLRTGKHSNKGVSGNGPLLELKNDEGDGTPNSHTVIEDENKIDIFTILGGGDYSTRSTNLTDGNIVTLLGGADVDLSEADSGKEVIEIDILAFMGGVDLRVPPHWQVTVKVLPILGGVSNKTTCLADKMQVRKKHLIVTGIALLGGVDIRN